MEEPIEEPMDEPMDDLEGLEDAPADDKPFDDEPFDAGVDADEDTDPEKYIQQLSGKLGQSLRQYTEDEGQPDFDLEKFAVNSVLSATHTGEMDKEDQRDIINQVKGAGEEDSDVEVDSEEEVDMETPDGGEEELDFGSEEGVEEIVEELPLNDTDVPVNTLSPEMDGMVSGCKPTEPIDSDAVDALKDLAVNEDENPCWKGYEQVGMKEKDGKQVPNCVPVKEGINEAEYQGKKVKLNKPMKGDVKKFKVYVKNDKGNVVKVNFGDPNMEIRRDDPEAKKSFRARHKCDQKKDKTSAGYWSCKMWSSKSVSDMLKESEKKSTFVDKAKLVKDLRLMENTEPLVEPKTKPTTKPATKPAKPMRETDRPFAPKRRIGVQPDPKAELNEVGSTPTISFDGKQVLVSSLEIEGVDRKDYPDFTDAFFSYGEYADGLEMSDVELEKFQNENLELLNELIFDRQLYM